jgi:ATP-binding cassette subfamily B protein
MMLLRSQVPGRERWYVDGLEDNPRLAAAVELVLRTEDGIEEVRANPITGRVLVRYRPESVSESVETLLCRAVEAGPMSREEFAVLRAEQPRYSFSKELLTAEIACSLSHIVLFGGICPLGLAATGALLLLHRRAGKHTHG